MEELEVDRGHEATSPFPLSDQGFRPDLLTYAYFSFLLKNLIDNCIQMPCRHERKLAVETHWVCLVCVWLIHCGPPRTAAREPKRKKRTLTENISSWIELVLFLFLILFFLLRKCFLLPSSLGADVDLSLIVERLLTDFGTRRRSWFGNNVFDVLVVQLTSQNLDLGVWDCCRQEEASDWTCGMVITSGSCSILPAFGCVRWLLSCTLQPLFLFYSMQREAWQRHSLAHNF